MSNLTLFNGGMGGEVATVPRATRKALEQVQGHGLVATAKVEAAAYVSHVAIQEVGMLSMEEAILVERCPHAAGRAKLIVDNFALTAANTVARIGYR